MDNSRKLSLKTLYHVAYQILFKVNYNNNNNTQNNNSMYHSHSALIRHRNPSHFPHEFSHKTLYFMRKYKPTKEQLWQWCRLVHNHIQSFSIVSKLLSSINLNNQVKKLIARLVSKSVDVCYDDVSILPGKFNVTNCVCQGCVLPPLLFTERST